MSAVRALITREIAASYAGGGGVMVVVSFAVMAMVILAFGLGPAVLQTQGLFQGGSLLVLALSTLLGLEVQWRTDHDNGALVQYRLGPVDMPMVAVVKIIAHWVVQILPIAAIMPVLGMMFGMPVAAAFAWALSLAVCGLGFCAIGSLAAALSLLSTRPGVLTAVLALPLFVPLAIFTAGGAWALLMAVVIISIAAVPFVIAVGIRGAL